MILDVTTTYYFAACDSDRCDAMTEKKFKSDVEAEQNAIARGWVIVVDKLLCPKCAGPAKASQP